MAAADPGSIFECEPCGVTCQSGEFSRQVTKGDSSPLEKPKNAHCVGFLSVTTIPIRKQHLSKTRTIPVYLFSAKAHEMHLASKKHAKISKESKYDNDKAIYVSKS